VDIKSRLADLLRRKFKRSLREIGAYPYNYNDTTDDYNNYNDTTNDYNDYNNYYDTTDDYNNYNDTTNDYNNYNDTTNCVVNNYSCARFRNCCEWTCRDRCFDYYSCSWSIKNSCRIYSGNR
jgi:hypothetical protein